MKTLNSTQLRSAWMDFYAARGHKIIPSASLIPENDPTVLFTTAGMHPLVPYLLGQRHPEGTRLADVQKCVRTGDIDEVGDATHLTFFEMLGNWSLGDYFKQEMIPWSFAFLTDVLGISVDRLAVSVFAGDENAPRDEESAALWHGCGIPKDRIFYLPKENNWWGPAGLTGPCGPDTEMFVDTGKPACGPDCSPACDCGKYVEVWNDVFMQYNKTEDGKFVPLSQKNVDTGMGLERTVAMMAGKKSAYDTDVFTPILAKLEALSGKKYADSQYTRAFRIVADHTRTASFIIGDPRGVAPGNVGQGYILRRLIRRAIRYGRVLELPAGSLAALALVITDLYKEPYPELKANEARILRELTEEEERFVKTLSNGLKEFEKAAAAAVGTIDGTTAFRLYDTFGFPIEMTRELAAERGLTVDADAYAAAFAAHQQKSRAEGSFQGGLADHSEQTTLLHTATHLLQAALRKVLGGEVAQKGSNITPERLRFDFSFSRKVEPAELAEVERLVNGVIAADVAVTCEEMTVAEAKAQGAMGLFESKYGEKVRVYTVGGFSKEICGGPHAAHTGQLISFKIQKEESSSAGVRRIKAVIGAAQ